MSDPFAHPGPITWVHITPGSQDQETGDRIPPATSETPITGDVQDITLRELKRYPEGLVEVGDRVLYSAAAISPGDRVTIAESDDTTSTWSVTPVAREYRLLAAYTGSLRRRYILKRMS